MVATRRSGRGRGRITTRASSRSSNGPKPWVRPRCGCRSTTSSRTAISPSRSRSRRPSRRGRARSASAPPGCSPRRAGPAVRLAARREPAQLAEEAAVVDILSNGRLDLGIGLGYRVPEYEGFGRPFANRFAQTEACLREVVRLWETGGVTPGPVQQPMSLWGGFFGPRGARLAGAFGAGLLAFDPNLMEPYRAGLAAGGHDPASARVAAVCNLVLADDPEAVWPIVKPHLAYQWDSYNRYSVEGTGAPE